MNKFQSILLVSALTVTGSAMAQSLNTSSQYIKAYSPSATPLIFRTGTDINTCKIPEAPIRWGMDTAWDSADNVRRGTNYIGKDVLSIGRVSFQPSDLVDENGQLSTAQRSALQSRLNHIAISGVKDIILNCDHEKLNKDNYYGKPYEWYRVIKASIEYAKSKGFNVITVSPFNEPDYTPWGEGTMADFRNIAKYISEDEELAGIRVSAGNTLNCDQAKNWYEYMKPYVSEGNTHQLAGSFDNYAAFWQQVRKDGNYATADELHNVAEAFVGVHYGMQAGVWWGYESAARGEYCRSSFYGKEIGYAENRKAWSAATVYKRDDGRIDAFLGTSERQATNSSYEFINTDRPVYFEGHGPTYNYVMDMPGGTGYQQGQTNAERMIQVQYGEDVPVEPIDSGTFVVMNRSSLKVMGYVNGASADGTTVTVGTYTNNRPSTHQQWVFERLSPRYGSDFGFYYIKSARNMNHKLDLLNWNTSEGANVCGFPGDGGANEAWALEYAGEGDWYIRSRHSGFYLTGTTSAITLRAKDEKNMGQRWRLMPTDAVREATAPAAPQGLAAEGRSASIVLTWTANGEEDLAGYQVERGTTLEDGRKQWDVIGRMITGTKFIDNTMAPAKSYTYRVKAIDKSRNRSVASATVEATTAEGRALVAHYGFNQNLTDNSENHLDAALFGKETYSSTLGKKEGTNSISVMSTNNNYMIVPPAAVNHKELTVAMWVYNLSSTLTWSRIFDFGNGTDQYIFLTPTNGSNMCLAFKNGGEEQTLTTTKLGTGTHHLAVTMSEDSVAIYVDGTLRASTKDITIRPSDINPVMNYIGRSQFASDPLIKAYYDDLRFYNYSLSTEEVKAVMNGESSDVQFAKLQELIKKGEELHADGMDENISAQLAEVLAEAKAVKMTDGGVAIEEAIDKINAILPKAQLAYNLATAKPGTGIAPEVTMTNKYVPTGSTEALMRATFAGSNIKERGVCWSTSHNPTVLDDRTQEYWTLNGNIYHVTGLASATVYYLRPYVMNTTYQVAYGDEVKIVTHPKGTCVGTWDEGAPDAAANTRCREAINQTIEYFNEWTGIKGFTLSGHYGAQTPTADCSYGGWMRIGPNAGNQAIGTVIHETGHGVGVGTSARYADTNLHNWKWFGRETNQMYSFLENKEADPYNTDFCMVGDGTHAWGASATYDWFVNGADKDKHIPLQYAGGCCLLYAMFVDGLCPTTAYKNGLAGYTYNFDDGKKYYIMCKDEERGLGDGLLYMRGSSSIGWKPMLSTGVEVSDSAAWYLDYEPVYGLYTFRNAASGTRYLTHASGGSQVTLKNMSGTAVPGVTERFQLMPDRTDVTIGEGSDKFKTHGYWFTWDDNGTSKAMSATNAFSASMKTGIISQAAFDFKDSATKQHWIIISEDELEGYKAMFPTAIRNIQAEEAEEGVESGIYGIDGVRQNGKAKGISIVRYSNGKVKRILTK